MSRTTALALPFTIAFSVLSLAACNTPENERDQSDNKSIACTVVTIDDDSYAIRCPDGSEAIIKNGSAGEQGEKGEPGDGSDSEACIIDKNVDGADIITCGDKSIVIGNNCEGGFPGSLYISGEGPSEGDSAFAIVSLLGCTEIQGDLSFYHLNEDGLPQAIKNIQHVGGSVHLMYSFSLQQLDLPNLKSVGGNLFVVDYSELTELSFPALESVGGSLILGASDNSWPSGINPLLETISFPMLTAIEQDLILYSNHSLPSLDGLSSLRTIGGNLHIEYNSALESLDGIKNLTQIEGNALILSNELLDTCAAIAQLESLPGFDPATRSDEKLIVDFGANTPDCP